MYRYLLLACLVKNKYYIRFQTRRTIYTILTVDILVHTHNNIVTPIDCAVVCAAGNMRFFLPCLHFPRPRMERGDGGRLSFADTCHHYHRRLMFSRSTPGHHGEDRIKTNDRLRLGRNSRWVFNISYCLRSIIAIFFSYYIGIGYFMSN